VQYDEFGFILDEWVEESSPAGEEAPPSEPHVPMRVQFPEAGSNYLGGTSDGWEYRTAFAGSRLAYAYDMIRQFLQEEGYGDVPLPESAADLKLFKKSRVPQLELFAERGYIHNPVKILFPTDPVQRNTLILCIYNEKEPNHLLRFHGLA
jgi:hypothetical protein